MILFQSWTQKGSRSHFLEMKEEGQLPNESDLFYVVKADDVEVEVPQRAVQKFASFSHALIHFWFRAVADGRDPSEVTCTQRAWVDSENH